MEKHVSIQEFLNSYNALENYLRDICGGDESRGMISLYKDTLSDPNEQLQLKTMNKLRNDIVHGVFSSNDPIKVDKSFIKLLEKHLRYVKRHQKEVRKAMLISMENRRKKDEQKARAVICEEPPEKHMQQVKPHGFTIKNIYLSDISGIISIEDAECFHSDFDYEINGDSLYIHDVSGIGTIYIPAGHYDLLSVSDVSGNIMVMTHKATFKRVNKSDIDGIFHIADY